MIGDNSPNPTCIVCGVQVQGDAEALSRHVNACLDGGSSANDGGAGRGVEEGCPICGKNWALLGVKESNRDAHATTCLYSQGDEFEEYGKDDLSSDGEVMEVDEMEVEALPSKGKKNAYVIDLTADSDEEASTSAAPPAPVVDHFKPCPQRILSMVRILPPPAHPNGKAAKMVMQQMQSLMAEQEKEGATKAGFYFDFERSHGNIFGWLVEMPSASFDQDLPIIKDMKKHKVTSLLFEIRFGETYPSSPPFFRIVYPRFLPFIYGGGGHVTGGGSICIDLLTATGWNASYTVAAILLQIRLAISNLEPRPARLDPHSWSVPYSMHEAVAGFQRAANTHGWKVPAELGQITRDY